MSSAGPVPLPCRPCEPWSTSSAAAARTESGSVWSVAVSSSAWPLDAVSTTPASRVQPIRRLPAVAQVDAQALRCSASAPPRRGPSAPCRRPPRAGIRSASRRSAAAAASRSVSAGAPASVMIADRVAGLARDRPPCSPLPTTTGDRGQRPRPARPRATRARQIRTTRRGSALLVASGRCWRSAASSAGLLCC